MADNLEETIGKINDGPEDMQMERVNNRSDAPPSYNSNVVQSLENNNPFMFIPMEVDPETGLLLKDLVTPQEKVTLLSDEKLPIFFKNEASQKIGIVQENSKNETKFSCNQYLHNAFVSIVDFVCDFWFFVMFAFAIYIGLKYYFFAKNGYKH